MKKLLFTAAIFALLFSPSAKADLKVGKSAPNFNVEDSNGKPVELKKLKGKIVVLEWKNHQCPFVKKHYETGNMQGLQKYAKNKNVKWISVISSAKGKEGYVTAKEANDIAATEGSNAAHIVLDPKGKLGKLFDAKVTPHMFVIDKEGVLAYMGAIDDKPTANHDDVSGAKNFVREAIDSLLKDKRPEVEYHKQYGCGVKY